MNESLEEAFGELIRQLSSLRKEVKAIRKSLNDERKHCYSNQEVMEMFGVATQTIKNGATPAPLVILLSGIRTFIQRMTLSNSWRKPITTLSSHRLITDVHS